MPSKQKNNSTDVASRKRAPMPRQSAFSKSFKKDWGRYEKAGRAPMSDIKKVMAQIVANDGPLAAELKDHELSGEWKGYRDCHVHGDLLLVYRISGRSDDERVEFIAIGTHAELFKSK